jgi:hypothetical protein
MLTGAFKRDIQNVLDSTEYVEIHGRNTLEFTWQMKYGHPTQEFIV